jgi:ribokinase
MNKKITVVGSYSAAMFFKGASIPGIGQTINGDEFFESGGGKGSNQAIAAAKLGGDVAFIGKIGDDGFAKEALEMYDRFNMDKSHVIIDKSTHTGVGAIFIDDDGNNSIMTVPGANYNLDEVDIDNALDVFKISGIVGFQLENRTEIVDYAIRKADELGAKVLLDPAPVDEIKQDLYKHLYIIKPNEHEATMLTGIEVMDKKTAIEAGEWFLAKGAQNAIITLGENGVVFVTKDSYQMFDSIKVKAIDTTGAGDCFSGALMASISKGNSIEEAIVFANKAAAYSVTCMGVVDALPNVQELEEFLVAQKNIEI